MHNDDRIELTALIDSIAAIPRSAGTLGEAVRQSLEAVCRNTCVVLARARFHHDAAGSGPTAGLEIWHSSLPARRTRRVREASETEGALEAGRAGESGVRHMRLAGATVDPVEGAARRSGMSSVVYLDVLAENRTDVSLQLFTDRTPKDEDALLGVLRLLAGVLGEVAFRQRTRAAVRGASRHARRQAAELEALQAANDQQAARIDALGVELAELQAESDLHSYRSRRPQDGTEARTKPRDEPADAPIDGRETDQAHGVRERRTGPAGSTTLYDDRTELPRREILEDRIQQAIRRRQRSPKNLFAVLAVSTEGLDDAVSESGDSGLGLVTTAMARRLLAQVRSGDTVAHLDADTFVLVLEEIRVLDEAVRTAERVVRELQRPVWTGSTEVKLGIRVGIVFGGPAYDRARFAIRDAVSALAKSRVSQSPVAVFDEAAQHEEEIRRQIEAELGKALAEDQLSLEYQPIVSLRDGRIDGIEAFLRWRHPEHGLIAPSQFIPIAAQSPIIHDIGVWTLERVCEQVKAWQKTLSRSVPTVDLNVTARQLFHERTPGRVREIVSRHGLRCEQFRFDIPEAELMRNPGVAARSLEELRDLGFAVAIDDFGTGFSSLKLLHGMPIDAVKIDREFVSGVKGSDALAVARTIVQLARSMDADVIAEGVETRDQFRFLRSIGCGSAQGYLFSAPVSPGRIAELIREGYPLEASPA